MRDALHVGPAGDPDRIRLGPAVAAGTEGVVYRGWTGAGTGRPVAVKMLQPSHLDRLDDWAVTWAAQVDLWRDLQVPGLVAVVDGFVGPLPHPAGARADRATSLYLVMEWVEGEPLDRWVGPGADVAPEARLAVLLPVAAALDQLHHPPPGTRPPVVHRDVKPANILVTDDGAVLVDIGSAREVDGDVPGAVVGTPGYVAPEVRREGAWSPAADRYSLGCVAFFLLAGQEPPAGAGPAELRRILTAGALSRRSDLLDRVMAMVDADPRRRPDLLTNWVAQLRRSSLALPPTHRLAPRAPRRRPSSARRGARVLGATTLLLGSTGLLASRALSPFTARQGDRPAAAPPTTAPGDARTTGSTVPTAAGIEPDDRSATTPGGGHAGLASPTTAPVAPASTVSTSPTTGRQPDGRAPAPGRPTTTSTIDGRMDTPAMEVVVDSSATGGAPVTSRPDGMLAVAAVIPVGTTVSVTCRAPDATRTGAWHYHLRDPYPGAWTPADRYLPADDPYDPRIPPC
jgi:serine/threonine protein kinase